MKALIRSGLGLALGLLAARAGAEETPWRSSKPAPVLSAPAVVGSAPVRLGLPRAVSEEATAGALSRPVTFGIVRAKFEPDPRPLPAGPSLLGDPGAGPKKPFTPARPTPVPGTLHYPGGGMVGGDSTGCGEPATCGDNCDSACCGPIRGWFRSRWSDCRGCFGGAEGGCFGGAEGGCFGGPFLGGGWCGVDCNDDRPRCWMNGSYLLWSIRGQNTPPLVVINPTMAPLTSNPGTTVVLGGEDMENEWRSGGRIQGGFWLPRHNCWGMDFGAFFLGHRTEPFSLSSNGSPQIGRFFINANGMVEDPEIVAAPGVAGGVSVDHKFSLWGVDGHLRRKLSCGPRGWCDGFIGYRHLNLDEKLTFMENLTILDPANPVSGFVVNDTFGTQNLFNGVDFGFQFERRVGNRWFVQGTCKVALGNMNQIVDISGFTTRTLRTGVSETRGGGVAASSTNIGKYTRNRFAVVPEMGVKIGFDITERVRIFAGYDFLWISEVVRAGEQIDPVINRARLPFAVGEPDPGVNRPTVLFRSTDFWAQGASFGLEWRF